jgi:YVTN family beta-propeller protein
VAAVDLKQARLLALLDVGKTPAHLALKPDGGELVVSNFDSESISFVETGSNEVGGTHLIGSKPARALVSPDNARLYVSNFGSNAVAVYDIDFGRIVASIPVGSEPDGLALTADANHLLVLDSGSGDVTVIEKRVPKKFEKGEYFLLTMIPVGLKPNGIAVKAFRLPPPAR